METNCFVVPICPSKKVVDWIRGMKITWLGFAPVNQMLGRLIGSLPVIDQHRVTDKFLEISVQQKQWHS